MAAIIVPRRTLFPAKRARALYERRNRDFIHRFPIRAGYRNVSSPPRGLHYGARSGSASFTREIFLASQVWIVPAGVTSFDALCVGGGASGGVTSWAGGFLGGLGGGGGGGSVVVVNGINGGFIPLDQMDIIVAAGAAAPGPASNGLAGSGSLIRLFAPPNTIFIQGGNSGGGGGGDSSVDPVAEGQAGTANTAPPFGAIAAGSAGGSGGGGGWFDGPPATPQGPGGAGAGGAGNGGSSSNTSGGTDPLQEGTGGGGGAGANGSAGTGAAGPGNGGDGIIPPDHSFGAWGLDIGEAGFFGGGGAGAAAIDLFVPPFSVIGNYGLGNGAANTGGGSMADVNNVMEAGRSGIVVVVYATP